MKENVLDKKKKLWEDLLFDLGKRNKMIFFRETKRSTLKLRTSGFDELYQRIAADEQELPFQKFIDMEKQPPCSPSKTCKP